MRRNLIIVPKPVSNAFNAFAKRASMGRYNTPEQIFDGLLSYGNDCYIDGVKSGLIMAGVLYLGHKVYNWLNSRYGKKCDECNGCEEDILPTMGE